MIIVIVTLFVIVGMCALFVFFLCAKDGCKAVFEPELLVIDPPAPEEDAAQPIAEEALELRS
jgi:hypothetical protein